MWSRPVSTTCQNSSERAGRSSADSGRGKKLRRGRGDRSGCRPCPNDPEPLRCPFSSRRDVSGTTGLSVFPRRSVFRPDFSGRRGRRGYRTRTGARSPLGAPVVQGGQCRERLIGGSTRFSTTSVDSSGFVEKRRRELLIVWMTRVDKISSAPLRRARPEG